MSGIRCLQIDAFADRPFGGNPAAVCLLEDEPPSGQWMQDVATEMNLSETAFVRRDGDVYDLRWFTPAIEVELCGHATLASAHALWSEGHAATDRPILFRTRSGVLTCTMRGNLIEMDFPATPPVPADPPAALLDALAVDPAYVGRSKCAKFVVVESERVVRALEPDFAKLREQLGKADMTAFQASKRGGIVRVRLAGDRVFLGGRAVTVMAGELSDAASR
jgi:PhzF family phenazine biosynthesis protein